MTKPGGSDWVSLKRAAEILGVHPATVRNWADGGKIRYRRTAGKHRRFHIKDLHALMEGSDRGGVKAEELQMIINSALGQARMEASASEMLEETWYQSMSDGTRRHMREQGRKVLQEIRMYVAQGASQEKLVRASRLGKEYATRLRADGISLGHAMRGFNFFGMFVVDSILTWSELSAPGSANEWPKALRQASAFLSAIQIAIIECYEED